MKHDGRRFEFWFYRVSHGELLIRSPKDERHSTNIDYIFVDVTYVDLPRCLAEVELSETTDVDVQRAEERLGKTVEHRNVHVLVSNGRRYLVVASFMKVVASELGLFETPFYGVQGKLWISQ